MAVVMVMDYELLQVYSASLTRDPLVSLSFALVLLSVRDEGHKRVHPL